MGADMIIATIAVPADRAEPLDFDRGRRLIEEITDVAQFEFDDPEYQLEDVVDDSTRAFTSAPTGLPTLATAQQAGLKIVDALKKALQSRETTFIEVAGYSIYIAGGLSWGDAPSEAAEALWNAYHLPAAVLEAIGFIVDHSEPLSRRNGNPGPVTDTDVVDAIALGLGTKSEWSSDELEWIPQLISSVRNDIIGEDPPGALKAFRDQTGSDPLECNFLNGYIGGEATEGAGVEAGAKIGALFDAEPRYTCVDCDSGDLTADAARWHAEHEGHCVVELADEDAD